MIKIVHSLKIAFTFKKFFKKKKNKVYLYIHITYNNDVKKNIKLLEYEFKAIYNALN